jgi:hypothetical protein
MQVLYDSNIIFFLRHNSPTRARAALFLRFVYHTQWHARVGRTPLDRWSAHSWYLYVTRHNTHMKQTSTPPAWFEPAIPASDRKQTLALDLSTIGTDTASYYSEIFKDEDRSHFWILASNSTVKSTSRIAAVNPQLTSWLCWRFCWWCFIMHSLKVPSNPSVPNVHYPRVLTYSEVNWTSNWMQATVSQCWRKQSTKHDCYCMNRFQDGILNILLTPFNWTNTSWCTYPIS